MIMKKVILAVTACLAVLIIGGCNKQATGQQTTTTGGAGTQTTTVALAVTDTNESVIDKMKTAKSCGRYQAINLQNDKTVEFRIFKGTLKYRTFIASLQFVKVISEYAKTVKLNDIPTTQWSDIFMSSNYGELRSYMEEKELF